MLERNTHAEYYSIDSIIDNDYNVDMVHPFHVEWYNASRPPSPMETIESYMCIDKTGRIYAEKLVDVGGGC